MMWSWVRFSVEPQKSARAAHFCQPFLLTGFLVGNSRDVPVFIEKKIVQFSFERAAYKSSLLPELV
jgi:hypothetical protein